MSAANHVGIYDVVFFGVVVLYEIYFRAGFAASVAGLSAGAGAV